LKLKKLRTTDRKRPLSQLELKDFATTPVKDILVGELQKSKGLLDRDYSPNRQRF
jgi:hypothetical protein